MLTSAQILEAALGTVGQRRCSGQTQSQRGFIDRHVLCFRNKPHDTHQEVCFPFFSAKDQAGSSNVAIRGLGCCQHRELQGGTCSPTKQRYALAVKGDFPLIQYRRVYP